MTFTYNTAKGDSIDAASESRKKIEFEDDKGSSKQNVSNDSAPFDKTDEGKSVPRRESASEGNEELEASVDYSSEESTLNVNESDLPRRPDKKEKFLTKRKRMKRISQIDGVSATYPPDCYSFLSIHGPETRFFWFGLMVFSFQVTFLFLMVDSVLNPNWKSGKVDDNPTDGLFADFINTESSPLVQATIIISLLTVVIFVDASVMDLVIAVHTFPNYSMVTKRDHFWRMAFSCILRFIQAFFACFVILVLVFGTNNVIDIILNFTALNFVSTLDDLAFEFAKSGKYGPAMEHECKRIEELPLPVCMYRNHKHDRYWITVVSLAVVMFIPATIIFLRQDSEVHWETIALRLQFKDESGLQDFNGCYHKDEVLHNEHYKRDFYVSDPHNKKNATFGYCMDEHRWYLYEGNLTEDPCEEEVIIRSSQTYFFDISTSYLDDWFSASGTPIELYFFDDEADAKKIMKNCGDFLGDGICNDYFNTDFHNFDNGDCCAPTCSHPNCWVGGLSNAFGSTNTSGDGFPNCKDPDMVNLTIHLNSFTNSREALDLSDENKTFINKFIPDFWEKEPADALLSMSCDDLEVLRYYINPTMINQSETVKVSDGAICEFRIENTTSSNPSFNDDPIWYVNYTIYDDSESMADRPIKIVQEYSFNSGVVSFEKIPECYYDTLLDYIDFNSVYMRNNPSSEAIHLLVYDGSRSTECRSYLVEQYALFALNFAAPIRSNSPEKRQWVQQGRPCTWANVLCAGKFDNTSDIIDLDLSNLRLSGVIATEIGLLSNLGLYDASKNMLTGSIPSEIGLLTELSLLRLKDNLLGGSMPTEMGLLTLMKEVFMASNSLTGSIPSEIGLLTDLVDLVMTVNKITGSIPSEVGLLTSLTQLRVDGNRLTGPIPSEIRMLTNLSILNMNGNNLTGSIPSEIGLLTSLTRLSIDKNAVTGSIPSEIGLLTSLTRLDIDETFLTGSFPTEMENLTKLKKIFMNDILIPKESVPSSLAAKITEPCILCANPDFQYIDSTNLPSYVMDDYSCAAILADFNDVKWDGRIAIDECNLLRNECKICNGSDQSDESPAMLLEMDPLQ